MVLVSPSIAAQSERLLLRPLLLSDAPAVNLMRSDPEVMKHTPIKPCNDVEKSKEWIQGCHTRLNCWNFCVELLPSCPDPPPREGTRVIGLMGAVRAPEIGYMFHRDYWGKGYATEALRVFLPLFFAHYDGEDGTERFEYAEALTDTELVASQRVLAKAGFVYVETREGDFENPVLGTRSTMVWRKYRDAN
ncbi:acyl-CoA N-acyltransferase [Westerdykella ornata]|uniref:Acyl-CoA N-acyltransferase n=1 Tax=Westerdykella ornata TaxID=318751 RepID=A0A6A6J5A6_WESOR|nr:acyl-CoA N-acyltransferase [Westerdykella ornata]KAF2271377.1 acyl-CoA N-acyltransferase [Westerdykella ornata]